MNRGYWAGLVLAAGSVGCASSGGTGFGPVNAAGAVAPGDREAAAACRVVAPPEVVASRVFVPAGVEAGFQDGRLTIRFAHRKAQCVVVAVLGGSGTDEAAASCPAETHDVVATSDGETLLARELTGDAGLPHVELGVAVYDAPKAFFGFAVGGRRKVIEQTFVPPQPERGERSPGLSPLPGERFLLTWVDGNPEGNRLHAQPVAGWGKAVGPALDLSPGDVSVIGRPSAAIGPDGQGAVAFLASNGDGFDVLATPISCSPR